MFNSKYSNVLTVLLIIVIIIIFALIAFLGYDMYRKYYIDKDANDYMERYEEQIGVVPEKENVVEEENTSTVIDPGNTIATETSNNNNNSSSTKKDVPTYKGFAVLGTIEIPKINIKYPIINSSTAKALETAICYYYGPGPNEVGNTVFVGHNYRNGAFFGKNKKLANGDSIYITDNSGKKIKYTIYNIYTTDPNDADYITRDTNGLREISLSTCTDDSKGRLIIWAKE